MQTDRLSSEREKYRAIYEETCSIALRASGLSAERMEKAALELQLAYEVYTMDFGRPPLEDPHEYFREMLREWPTPWDALGISALNGLTLAQFHYVWAWNQSESANWFLSVAASTGVDPADAVTGGLKAAAAAAKSLSLAHALTASGNNELAQRAL